MEAIKECSSQARSRETIPVFETADFRKPSKYWRYDSAIEKCVTVDQKRKKMKDLELE